MSSKTTIGLYILFLNRYLQLRDKLAASFHLQSRVLYRGIQFICDAGQTEAWWKQPGEAQRAS